MNGKNRFLCFENLILKEKRYMVALAEKLISVLGLFEHIWHG